jgi:hypothetical protein
VLGCGWTFAAYLPAFHVPLAMFGDPGPVCIFMKLPASAGFEALEDVDDPFFWTLRTVEKVEVSGPLARG